jgi:hypothetical protein
MELKEYLNHSKEKRGTMLKTAQEYMKKNDDRKGREKEQSNEECDDIFKGPSVKRLMVFKDKVENEVRRLFTPDLCVENKRRRFLVDCDANEQMRRIYAYKSQILKKKKQVVILPKNRFATPIKSINKLEMKRTENFSLKHSKKKRTITPNKELTYMRFPVLFSTINTISK